MIKTAVIGASGYIGAHLFRKYRESFPDCIGTGFSRMTPELTSFDLRNPEKTSLRLQETGHEAVIVSSAIPNIAWCESHPKESHELNVQGTLKLAKLLAKTPIRFYFMSTDYVFDGREGGYTDQAKTCPNTEYGRQKAEVERELPNIFDHYTILRLSKIYGTAWKDKTLIDDLASSLLQGKTLAVATDQFFTPTHVEDVVAMSLFIQEQQVEGVVNLCHSEVYSRQQIAQKLVDVLGISPSLLQSTKLHTIAGMEYRPLNTSLICSSILKKIQSQLWTIDKAIEAVARNWKNNS